MKHIHIRCTSARNQPVSSSCRERYVKIANTQHKHCQAFCCQMTFPCKRRIKIIILKKLLEKFSFKCFSGCSKTYEGKKSIVAVYKITVTVLPVFFFNLNHGLSTNAEWHWIHPKLKNKILSTTFLFSWFYDKYNDRKNLVTTKLYGK